jgi:hypothetical protein
MASLASQSGVPLPKYLCTQVPPYGTSVPTVVPLPALNYCMLTTSIL